jgi:hypothetical protein
MITNTIKDSYLDIDSEDYVKIYSNRIKANEESADKDCLATVAKQQKKTK